MVKSVAHYKSETRLLKKGNNGNNGKKPSPPTAAPVAAPGPSPTLVPFCFNFDNDFLLDDDVFPFPYMPNCDTPYCLSYETLDTLYCEGCSGGRNLVRGSDRKLADQLDDGSKKKWGTALCDLLGMAQTFAGAKNCTIQILVFKMLLDSIRSRATRDVLSDYYFSKVVGTIASPLFRPSARTATRPDTNAT